MVWQFVDALIDMSDRCEIFTLPEKQVYQFKPGGAIKGDETFIGKSVWTYDFSDSLRIIIPYQKDLVDNWLAIETQDDIFWHSILSKDVEYKNIIVDEDNPFMSEFNKYGDFAFFVKPKGIKKSYSLMSPDVMIDFCDVCCDVFSEGSENTRLSEWVFNNGAHYSFDALAYYFCRKDNLIKRGVAYHQKGIFSHKND